MHGIKSPLAQVLLFTVWSHRVKDETENKTMGCKIKIGATAGHLFHEEVGCPNLKLTKIDFSIFDILANQSQRNFTHATLSWGVQNLALWCNYNYKISRLSNYQ